MDYGFVDRFVCILELDVLSDDSNFHLVKWGFEATYYIVPDFHVVIRRIQFEMLDHKVINIFRFKSKRQFVDRCFYVHFPITDLTGTLQNGRAFAASHWSWAVLYDRLEYLAGCRFHVVWQPTVGWVWFLVLRRFEVRYQGAVQKEDVLSLHFQCELTHGFKKGVPQCRQSFHRVRL